jgi:hypothetical protein
MTKLEQEIIKAMIETGRAGDGWRFRIQSIEENPCSDWATITGVLLKKRRRSPSVCWELSYYKPKDQIWWEKSKFVNFAE